MFPLPTELTRRYESLLTQQAMPCHHRPHYLRWLRYYWDFCHWHQLEPTDCSSLAAFEEKLRAEQKPDFQRQQAHRAVSLYYQNLSAAPRPQNQAPVEVHPNHCNEGRSVTNRSVVQRTTATAVCSSITSVKCPSQNQDSAARPIHWQIASQANHATTHAVAPVWRTRPQEEMDSPSVGVSWISVYDGLNSAVAVRHYSPKTLQAYRHWTRKFQAFTRSKEPGLLSNEDVKGFLNFLAVDKKVAASSQNQAFNALLFLFKQVLGKEFGNVEGVIRAKRRKYIPVVLSRAEVDRVIRCLAPPYDLVVKLLYGCGLRLFECLKLRVQDLNFELKVLTIHDGKGQKDRTVPLPQALDPALRAQLETVMRVHRDDLAAGYAGTFLPGALRDKYKRAERELVWQWLFPAKTLIRIPGTSELRRYHLHETHVQKAIKEAVRSSQIPKRVSAHSFRHSFASHLLAANYDIRTIQELLGHSDLKTTMIYTHTVPSVTRKDAKSPLDF